ncbi:hypothetical protein GCM10029992_17400 [Glycomyces albus]
MSDDLVLAAGVPAGGGLVAVDGRVGRVDAHAVEEALVPCDVDRDDLVVEQVDHRDDGLVAAELGGGPLADALPGQEVVGGEGDVDRLGIGRRRVQRDDVQARVARPHERVLHARSVRGDEDALVTAGDGVLDRLDLGVLVAVLAARGECELDADLLGGGFGALLHGHEEGVGGGLDDERDADGVLIGFVPGAAPGQREHRADRECAGGHEGPAEAAVSVAIHR